MKESEAKARWREKLHARGLCITCHKPLGFGREHRLQCAECAMKTRDRNRDRIDRLSARGLCIDCGQREAIPGRRRCRSCLLARAEFQYNLRHGRKQ